MECITKGCDEATFKNLEVSVNLATAEYEVNGRNLKGLLWHEISPNC